MVTLQSQSRKFQNIGILAITNIAAITLLACTQPPSETLQKEVRTPQSTPTETIPQTYEMSSSDRNHVTSMLFQWWGLFESSGRLDSSNFIDTLFVDNLHVKLGELELQGLESFKSVYNQIPQKNKSSHAIEKLEITPLGNNEFELNVVFTFNEISAANQPRTMRTQYSHKLLKTADGNFVFTHVTAKVLEHLDTQPFTSSYYENRARAALMQYLAITDVMDSDYSGLNTVIHADSKIHGMFDPAKDTFNTRGDGTLIGLEEISNWLSSRKEKFSSVAHELKSVTLTPLEEGRFEASTEIKTQAFPHNGKPIEVLLPVKVTFKDDGQKFMQIEQIN